jgi:hypothetical protein
MRHLVQTLTLVAIVGSIALVAVFTRQANPDVPPAQDGSAPPVAGARASAVPVNQSTGSDLVPLAPADPPKELPGECSNFSTSTDGAPRTIESMAGQASVIALVSVMEIGPAQWNTRDGAPPADRVDWNADSVMRLLRVKVDRLASGVAPDVTTVWVSGGTIGCRMFLTDRVPEIEVGGRFAIFATDIAPATGLKDVLRGKELWTIAADNTVTDPDLGKITLDEFVARAAASAP